MRDMTRLLPAICVLLLVPATACAGGWTTVGLDQPPSGVAAGDEWNATLTILQHGRTPLDGEKPVLTISDGTTSKDVTAVAAGKPGVYHARVVFPSAGRWRVSVDHGWGVTHRFAAVDVGARAAAGGGGDPDWLAAAGIALAAGLLAALSTTAATRRRAVPAP
jgi:hypothetical protein